MRKAAGPTMVAFLSARTYSIFNIRNTRWTDGKNIMYIHLATSQPQCHHASTDWVQFAILEHFNCSEKSNPITALHLNAYFPCFDFENIEHLSLYNPDLNPLIFSLNPHNSSKPTLRSKFSKSFNSWLYIYFHISFGINFLGPTTFLIFFKLSSVGSKCCIFRSSS